MTQANLGWIADLLAKGKDVENAGGTLPRQNSIRFLGSVSIADNPTNGSTDVTVGTAGGQYTTSVSNGLNSNVPTNGLTSLRLGGATGAFSIGGLALPSGAPVADQRLVIVNTTSQPMTIVHEDASSTAANRISTKSGLAVSFLPRQSSASFVYDGTISRWVMQSADVQVSTTQFTGDTLAWSLTTLFTGMVATVTGLTVPCAAGAVMHVGRPPTWPPGVVLSAFATAANTVTLEAVNCSGTSQTLPTAITDLFSVSVHQ